MTESTKQKAAVGDRFHVLADGLSMADDVSIIPRTITLRRGAEHVITRGQLDASRDRTGVSWLEELLYDPDAQIARWGQIMIAPGSWPQGEPVFIRGSVPALLERERRRLAAQHTYEGTELSKVLAEIDRELGKPSTVTDMGSYTR